MLSSAAAEGVLACKDGNAAGSSPGPDTAKAVNDGTADSPLLSLILPLPPSLSLPLPSLQLRSRPSDVDRFSPMPPIRRSPPAGGTAAAEAAAEAAAASAPAWSMFLSQGGARAGWRRSGFFLSCLGAQCCKPRPSAISQHSFGLSKLFY